MANHSKSGRARAQFGLRTLLIMVALVGVGIQMRPATLRPEDIALGMSKARVAWSCGKPAGDYSSHCWAYPRGELAYFVYFDDHGKVMMLQEQHHGMCCPIDLLPKE